MSISNKEWQYYLAGKMDGLNIIKKIPKNELIKLVHISQEFMKKKAKTKKQITALYAEKKKLGMKPKEFCHYKGWWGEYVKYVQESI